MKKYFIVIVVLSFFACVSTPYSVSDDGVLEKDKTPIGKVEGEVGLMVTDELSFFNEGEEILRVEEQSWESPYPDFKRQSYYKLNFPKHNEEIYLKNRYGYNNEKKLIKYLLNDNGLNFYKDGLKDEEVKTIVSKNSAKDIHNDTTRANEYIEFYQDVLANNRVEYPDHYTQFSLALPPYELKESLPPNTTQVIYRKSEKEGDYAPILVGAIVYFKKESNVSVQENITIYSKLESPLTFKGDSYRFVKAAYLDFGNAKKEEIFAYQPGEKIEMQYSLDFKKSDIIYNAVKALKTKYYL